MSQASPARLPRGRHGLSREEVVRSQRARILRALVDGVAQQGYVATPVADVLRRAGVSRETFYEQFASKEDCFAAAFEEAVDRILDGAELLAAAPVDPMERFALLLRAYLDRLASDPALARVFLLEVYAAGPTVLRRRLELQDRFTTIVARALEVRDERERFACETLVAAVSAMVSGRVATGEGDRVTELYEPLLALVHEAVSRR